MTKEQVLMIAIPTIGLMTISANAMGHDGYLFTTGVGAITLIIGYLWKGVSNGKEE